MSTNVKMFQVRRTLTITEFYEFPAKNKAEALKLTKRLNQGDDADIEYELVYTRDEDDTEFVLTNGED